MERVAPTSKRSCSEQRAHSNGPDNTRNGGKRNSETKQELHSFGHQKGRQRREEERRRWESSSSAVQRNLDAPLSLHLARLPPPPPPKSLVCKSETGAPVAGSALWIGPKTGICAIGSEVKLAREATAHEDGADEGVEEEEEEEEEEEDEDEEVDEEREAGSCRRLSQVGSTTLSGA
ncbi:hypothetical protein E2320_017347 [Naja naja]|nr:hypothetical protein E2320_017347 [Naja naja]